MLRVNVSIADFLLFSANVKNALNNKKLLFKSIVNELVSAFRENFQELNSRRSKYGHNFYTREGANKTIGEVSADGGKVIVASYQMAHKLTGGRVYAKNVRNLSIPISEEARSKGLSPSLWKSPRLFLLKAKSGKVFLAANGSKGAPPVIHFLLLKSVFHQPHVEVLPSDDRLQAALDKGVQNAKFLESH